MTSAPWPFDMAAAKATIEASNSTGSDGYVEYWGPDALEHLKSALARIEELESTVAALKGEA